MKNNFHSSFTEMNSFLSRLEFALEHLPENPNSEIKGFYLSYYNPKKEKLVSEKIGFVEPARDFRYLHCSTQEVTKLLIYGEGNKHYLRKKNPELQSGAFGMKTEFGVFITSVAGFDAELGEAISALWLIAKKIMNEMGAGEEYATTPDYFFQIQSESDKIKKEFLMDNQYIIPLAQLMQIYV